jgi:hypothetical protein
VREIGVERTPMSKPDKPGYTALQLDGPRLRAPYLHNGSVPTVRALLERPECRPKVFYRGYDLIDRENVGFVSQRCESAPAANDCAVTQTRVCMPPDKGWRYDTTQRGNSNGGHVYGTDLATGDKVAVVEYLKTL